jgi:predicted DNA-binding protein
LCVDGNKEYQIVASSDASNIDDHVGVDPLVRPAEQTLRMLFLSDKCCYNVRQMASNRITVRVPHALTVRLRSRSQAKGTTESELVREALESYLGHSTGERSAYELAKQAGIIGYARRAPKDLSTNPRHFKGFGNSKR